MVVVVFRSNLEKDLLGLGFLVFWDLLTVLSFRSEEKFRMQHARPHWRFFHATLDSENVVLVDFTILIKKNQTLINQLLNYFREIFLKLKKNSEIVF